MSTQTRASGGTWLQDEQGRWYSVNTDGSRFYNAPSFKEQATTRPGDSFFRDTVWDTTTGQYKKKTNWGNIIGLAAMAPTGIAAAHALAGGAAAAGSSGAPAGWAGSEVAGVANAATHAATGAGAGMKFGAGALAKFFNSAGGSAAINAGTQLLGGVMQSRAIGHASDVQAQAAQQALEFAKAQYAEAVKAYAPYLQASQAQIPGLQDFLSQSRPPQGGYPISGQAPSMPQGTPPASPVPVGSGQTPAAAAQSGMVRMQSPTGEVRLVQSGSIQKYLSRGMRLVG